MKPRTYHQPISVLGIVIALLMLAVLFYCSTFPPARSDRPGLLASSIAQAINGSNVRGGYSIHP